MVRNPVKRSKLRTILLYVILATLPCYLLGMIVLWIGNTVKAQGTITPTVAATTEVPWGGEPTNTLPPIPTYAASPTITPTITTTPSPSATYFIPSNTPTISPTSSATLSATPTITETVTPTPTDTETIVPVESSVSP
jgi:hypothetical protein